MVISMYELDQHNSFLSETDSQQCSATSGKENETILLFRVGQLEGELQLKNRALILSQKEQTLLRKRLKSCVENITTYSKQIADIRNNLKDDFKLILERIESLEQEIEVLNHSNEAWSKRAIALQFDVLTAQDEEKKIHADREVAFNKITDLELALKAVKKENNKLMAQDINGYSRGRYGDK
jgi:chromosome segregation ATPase